MAALGCSSPCELKLVRVLEGGYARERELHDLFASHRVHREWFSDDILPEILGMDSEYHPVTILRYAPGDRSRPKKGWRKVSPNSMLALKWEQVAFLQGIVFLGLCTTLLVVLGCVFI